MFHIQEKKYYQLYKKMYKKYIKQLNNRGFEPLDIKLWQYKEKKLVFTAKFKIKEQDEE